MGFWINKLKSLPMTFDWYMFLVGDYRNHSMINDFFREDFCIIADRIGEDVAIVAQNTQLEDELQENLKQIEGGKLGKFFSDLEQRNPGILILNKHPKNLYHLNELMQKLEEDIPSDWDSDRRQNYLIDSFNKNRNKYSKLRKDDIVIYIPFELLERVYSSTNSLIADIVSFSKNQNKNLLKKTSKVGHIIKSFDVSTSVGLNLGIVAFNFEI